MESTKKTNYESGDENLLNGFVTASKAMQLLDCGKTKLYYMRERDKVLVYTSFGNKIFYELKSIQNLIEKNKRGGENAL